MFTTNQLDFFFITQITCVNICGVQGSEIMIENNPITGKNKLIPHQYVGTYYTLNPFDLKNRLTLEWKILSP